MLLDSAFYLTKKVDEVDGKIQVQLVPRNADELARLNDIDPRRGSHFRGRASYAHGEDAAWVDVESVQTTSIAGKRQVTLTLRPARGASGVPWSSDDARAQAHDLLLAKRLSNSGTGNFSTYSGNRAQSSLFAVLWNRLNDGTMPVGDFLRCARLEAIFQLKTKGTAEHVLTLALGPVQAGVVAVKFRGRLAKSHGGGNSPFEVTGTCDLTDA